MLFIKNNAKLLIGVCVSLAVGLALGFFFSDFVKQPEPEPPVYEFEPVGAVGEVSILPDTQVITRHKFALCGHDVERTELDGPFTGCTETELNKRLTGESVKEFSKSRVVIERQMQAYCPEHFVLTLNEQNKITISHTDSEDLETIRTQTLSYDVSALPDEVLLLLRESLVFDELEEINSFFEDVES